MSYIPTTEEIRQEFHDAFVDNSMPLEFSSSFVTDKFDRWLEHHDAEVAKTAKEDFLDEITDNFMTYDFAAQEQIFAYVPELMALVDGSYQNKRKSNDWFEELTPEQRKHYRNDLSEIGRWQFEKGVEYAEERIVKLLEEDAIAWSPQCSLPLDIEHCQYCAERVLLIESIRGENK